ncbi:MAG: hypothetical protein R3332_09470 [Pseudohongiellaceae bacterium]|nr:hypothetical protein [Pseudohongiellaceae bacterium]
MNNWRKISCHGALLIGLLFSSAVWSQLNVPAVEIRELSRECTYGDCENGYGVLSIKTNVGENTYRGEFKDGKYHGNGTLTEMLTVTQRAYYEGNWDNGKRSGRGTYFNGQGNLYIGQWKNDKREGRGSYFFGVSDWTPNKYSEHWLSENVENYTGEFKNDLYHGQGTYRWPDGQKYIGGFFANDKHGPGTFVYPRGSIRKQVWEYGEFVR